MKKILQYGNSILEKKSLPVLDYKEIKIQTLIKEMLSVLNSDPEKSAGLSAPQIGESLRIAVCRRSDLEIRVNKKSKKIKPIWEVMINPEIIFKSDEQSINWEGCLSINFGNLFGKVNRAKHVEVKYTTLDGIEKSLKASDFMSHIIQHEVDHLNGILFLKYIKDPEELYTTEELINE